MTVKPNLVLIALLLGIGNAAAVPVHTSNANVSSWDVGLGQFNGNFSVTTDSTFAGAGIQLGLRAEQRSAGAVVPTFNDQYPLSGYVVNAGTDTTQPNLARAWWNFQLSIASNLPIGPATPTTPVIGPAVVSTNTLDALTLQIVKLAGSNSSPTPPGIYDLIALRTTIDDRNCPGHPATPCTPHNPDPNYLDIYQVDQNPVFGWFSPAYSLAGNETFAYRFTLTATEAGQSVSSSMCVATPGLTCSTAVPEPASLGLLGIALAALGMTRRRKKA